MPGSNYPQMSLASTHTTSTDNESTSTDTVEHQNTETVRPLSIGNAGHQNTGIVSLPNAGMVKAPTTGIAEHQSNVRVEPLNTGGTGPHVKDLPNSSCNTDSSLASRPPESGTSRIESPITGAVGHNAGSSVGGASLGEVKPLIRSVVRATAGHFGCCHGCSNHDHQPRRVDNGKFPMAWYLFNKILCSESETEQSKFHDIMMNMRRLEYEMGTDAEQESHSTSSNRMEKESDGPMYERCYDPPDYMVTALRSSSETNVKGQLTKPSRERKKLDDKREWAFQEFREQAARQKRDASSTETAKKADSKSRSQTFPRSAMTKVEFLQTSPPARSEGRTSVQSLVKEEYPRAIEMHTIIRNGQDVDTVAAGKDTGIHEQMSTSILSASSDGAICRICHEDDSSEDLLSPCHCTGTVGLLHLSCMEKWFGSSNTTKCELCHFEYTVDRKPKPFSHWLRHPSGRNDRRNLVCDVVCFCTLTPLAAISSWLCLVGAQHYSMWAGRWEVPGLISLTAMLITIYLIWCLVVVRYHYRIWSDWKHHNQIVRIRAVKKGMLKNNAELDRPFGSPQSANSQASMSNSSANNNNNNNNSYVDCYANEEDVVVEVTGGSGQREWYRLLSESSNLLRSPNSRTYQSHPSLSSWSPVWKPRRQSTSSPRRQSTSSPRRQSTSSPLRQSTSSPRRHARRGRRTCSDSTNVKAPLLEELSGSNTSYVNRSLMADPLFHGSPITYEPLASCSASVASPSQSFAESFDCPLYEGHCPGYGLSMSDTLLNEGRCKIWLIKETTL